MHKQGKHTDEKTNKYYHKLAWVKVFRISPEFRILRLTFHRKLASKCWIREITIANSDLFSVCLKTIGHLNLKMWIFCGHAASFTICFSKGQDFWNFELSPMKLGDYNSFSDLFSVCLKTVDHLNLTLGNILWAYCSTQPWLEFEVF